MKHTVVVLAALSSLALAACDDGPEPVRIVEQPALEQPEFEFTVDYFSSSEDWARANELGTDGWEIVSARWARSGDGDDAAWGYEVIMQRRKP